MYPVIIDNTNAMPSVQGGEAFAATMFGAAFDGFGAAGRFLTAKKMDFRLRSGSDEQVIENGKVVGVLLGVAEHDHCSWYARKYQEGQEPAAPDLLWIRYTPDTFPDALPAQFRKKVNVGGAERWDFRIARRTIWGLCTVDTNGQMQLDLDNPVIFDMTSASMFGKSAPQMNAYKWVGLRSFCERWSVPGVRVNPAMFLTQIAIDSVSPVPGVVVFRPMLAPSGGPAWLDNTTYQAVMDKASSSELASMLKVTEILTLKNGVHAAPAPAPTMPPVPPVQVATQPAAPAAPTVVAQPQPAPAAPAQPAAPVAPTQPEMGGLLAEAQAIINNAYGQTGAQPAPAPAAPAAPAQPAPQQAAPQSIGGYKVSEAAAAGIQNLTSSLEGL